MKIIPYPNLIGRCSDAESVFHPKPLHNKKTEFTSSSMLTKHNTLTQKRPIDSGNPLRLIRIALSILLLYAAIAPLPSCTRSGEQENDAEILARITDLTEQANALQRTNTDSAILLQRQALDALQTVHNDSLRAAVLIRLGISYSIESDWVRSDSCYAAAKDAAERFPPLLTNLFIDQAINQDKRGNAEEALALYDRAYELAKQAMPPDEKTLQRIDHNRAASYQHRAQYDSAMICLQRAMQTAEKQSDRDGMAGTLMNMGNVRFRMHDNEQADSLFRLAEEIYASLNDVRMLINIKSNRIVALKNLGLYDEALAVSLDAERLADSIGAKNMLGSVYNNRGSIYFDQKDYRRSLEMARRSLELKEQLGDTIGLIASLNSAASIHIEMKEYAGAIQECQKALQLSEEKHLTTYLCDIYENIATAHGRSGDFQAAVAYLEKKNALRDSVFTKEKYAVIEEMKTRYETEKQEQTLQIAMLRLKKNRQGLLALAILSVLLSGAFVYVYTAQRRKLRQHVSIARQGEKVDELTERTLAPQCGSDETERSAAGLSEEKSNELLRSLRDCMEVQQMYKDPSITLDILAKAVGTNRTYLSVLINSRMKRGFSEYVNFYRIREAKRMLKDTDSKIALISQEVGFGTQQSFYTAFRNAEQLTPAQYRKAARGKS